MSAAPSQSRAISAIETLIAIVELRIKRPRSSEMEMLIHDAKAGLETLRGVSGATK